MSRSRLRADFGWTRMTQGACRVPLEDHRESLLVLVLLALSSRLAQKITKMAHFQPFRLARSTFPSFVCKSTLSKAQPFSTSQFFVHSLRVGPAQQPIAAPKRFQGLFTFSRRLLATDATIAERPSQQDLWKRYGLTAVS